MTLKTFVDYVVWVGIGVYALRRNSRLRAG
jgi:hypothetical protein